MRISIALGTHNGATYLEEQLRSILAQTRLPDELVLSDDASTDGTPELAARVLNGSPIALTVLRNDPALGVTANFEQALAACSGELLILSDQDDVWEPERVSQAAAAFDETPELMLLGSDAQLIDGAGALLGIRLFEALGLSASERQALDEGRAFEILLTRNLVTGATVMLRREVLETARPFPAEWVHDEWLAVIASLLGRVELLEEPLVRYRQHGANQIGVRKLSLVGKVRRLFEPRAQTNAKLAGRARALVERVASNSLGTPERRVLAEAKSAHQARRAALPGVRALRLPAVLRELAGGSYDRFARGWPDAFRDITQKRLG